MWPRLIAQLIELLPHVSRLVPVADKYFSSKAASDHSQVVALSTLSETVRSDIASISDSQTALAKQVTQQLTDQAAKTAVLQRSLIQAESDNVKMNQHLEWLTKDVNSLRLWVKFGIATMVLLLAVILALVVKLYLAH